MRYVDIVKDKDRAVEQLEVELERVSGLCMVNQQKKELA